MLRRTFMLLAVAGMVALASPAYSEEGKAGTHEGKVVKAGDGKLTMSDKDGKNEHTHPVASDAKITCEGKECKLEDLKAGYTVKVTTESKDKKNVATKIEAKKS